MIDRALAMAPALDSGELTDSPAATAGGPASPPLQPTTPRRRRGVTALISVVVLFGLLTAPFALVPYQQDLLTRILIYALLAMSLDLVYGYAGMISLGHAAFFGAGAYAIGLLEVRAGITNFWVGAPVAIVCAALLAAVVGFVALRTRGIYFVLVTFAMGQMVYSLAQQWDALHTSGAEAVVGITPPTLGLVTVDWSSANVYYFTLVVVAIGTAVLFALTRNRFGTILRGIRENQQRMAALGFNTWLYQYVAFIASGAIAGVAGVLFAYYSGIVAPSNVDVSQSGLLVLMIIIGGTGRLWGGIIGAIVVELTAFLAEQHATDHQNLVLGILFVVTLVVLRVVARRNRSRRSRRRTREATAHA